MLSPRKTRLSRYRSLLFRHPAGPTERQGTGDFFPFCVKPPQHKPGALFSLDNSTVPLDTECVERENFPCRHIQTNRGEATPGLAPATTLFKIMHAFVSWRSRRCAGAHTVCVNRVRLSIIDSLRGDVLTQRDVAQSVTVQCQSPEISQP